MVVERDTLWHVSQRTVLPRPRELCASLDGCHCHGVCLQSNEATGDQPVPHHSLVHELLGTKLMRAS